MVRLTKERRQAYHDGKMQRLRKGENTRNDNPFTPDSTLWHDWDWGWSDTDEEMSTRDLLDRKQLDPDVVEFFHQATGGHFPKHEERQLDLGF